VIGRSRRVVYRGWRVIGRMVLGRCHHRSKQKY
jgi:hypothetical protein